MTTPRPFASRWYRLTSIAISALLLGLYARGGNAWPLGFVMLVPWLLALNTGSSFRGALLDGWLMSVAFALAIFAWFASAIGAYTGIGTLPAVLNAANEVAVAQLPVVKPLRKGAGCSAVSSRIRAWSLQAA